MQSHFVVTVIRRRFPIPVSTNQSRLLDTFRLDFPMPIHARFVGDVAVLSGIARLMNDPRHFDSIRDVRALLDQGYLRFVLEMGGVRETGSVVLGLLTSLTRMVRNDGGEMVLANLSPQFERFLDEMRMDDYWDVFEEAESAVKFLENWRTKSRVSER